MTIITTNNKRDMQTFFHHFGNKTQNITYQRLIALRINALIVYLLVFTFGWHIPWAYAYNSPSNIIYADEGQGLYKASTPVASCAAAMAGSFWAFTGIRQDTFYPARPTWTCLGTYMQQVDVGIRNIGEGYNCTGIGGALTYGDGSGSSLIFPMICVDVPAKFNPKAAPGKTSCATEHPITFEYGNKYLADYDYIALSLEFKRIYTSISTASSISTSGFRWANKNSVLISPIGGLVYSYRPDGTIFTYSSVNNFWLPDADIPDKLIELKDGSGVRTGWTYTVDATGEIERYDATGKLLSIADRAGLTQTMLYSDASTATTTAPFPGLLIRVTDASNRQLNFTYDNLNRIRTMTNPAGDVYTYAYDATNNLSSVTYPDGKIKTYLYGESAYVSSSPASGVDYLHALTGIIDENNTRYATYYYDAQGRAYQESLAGGADAASLAYSVDGNGNPTSTAVTDSRGSVRTYNFTTILGVVKSTGQSQPGGAGCSASASALTYDANGNVSTRTDFNGIKTTYVYDMSRNLELSRTEALTSAGAAIAGVTRTITTTWHPTWRLPLVISEYNGASASGTALRTTTNVYDARGNITSLTETDPVRSLSRVTTTSYTYSSAVPGLVLTKVVNGPRTDVTDTTTYTYYPHDATCTASTSSSTATNLGCRGQLQTLTNALGQTTTYSRYNHHGQVEQMSDPNGLITTTTYDLRQRLLTRTIGTELTKLDYDGVGQVTKLTLPDASTLSYTYDAAHRLTQVEDKLGNKVVYTLDSEGNRTNETTQDPSGTLAKTLTRSYDALNRLQQVTGTR